MTRYFRIYICRFLPPTAVEPRTWLAAALVLLFAARATAAGGPENVLVVVNPRSPDSLCIANHYAALRNIPVENFLFLDWDLKQESTDIATFREKILIPVMQVARAPIPGRQIDYVAYSSGFPTIINVEADIKKFTAFLEKNAKDPKGKPDSKALSWIKYMTPYASLSGLTYLYEPVLASAKLDGVFYVYPNVNWYARTGAPEQKNEPSLSFSSIASYGAHGEPMDKGGRHYVLSMALGVTSGRGNTLEEVLAYLRRSAAADNTHPRGTIYYVQNADVRSTVRQAGYPDAVKQLKALGVAAQILEGSVPKNKPDVQGAMLGVADFNWKESGSNILPGAICEHFTSFGGDMSSGASQTPLSQWLRYGAAATCGTVTEPYAIAQKFPAPTLHVHYARGCTAAESFYQSVMCPYQLLIVGDPLCSPWANVPEITVSGLTPGSTVRGELKIAPKATFANVSSTGEKATQGGATSEKIPPKGGSTSAGIPPKGGTTSAEKPPEGGTTSAARTARESNLQIEHFELVLDGQKIRECAPGGTLAFDTAAIADGAHELRVVAMTRGPLIAQGEKTMPFTSANRGRKIEVTCEPEKKVSLGKSLRITVKSPDSTAIEVIRGMSALDRIDDIAGRFEIPAAKLGRGPVRLLIIGLGNAGPKSNVIAPPLDIEVE
jgi:hypothetical protein